MGRLVLRSWVVVAGGVACGCGGSGRVADAARDSGPSAASGAAAGSAEGASVAGVDRCVTLTMDPFDVTPGGERYVCQQFSNPFGRDVDLLSTDGTASQGMVEFQVFSMTPDTARSQAAPGGDCPGEGLELHPAPFVSQQSRWTVTYPRGGMGYPVPMANGLMLDAHYLNLGTSTIHATASATLCSAKPGVVTTHVGTIFLYNTSLTVPPTPMSNPVTVSDTFDPTAGKGIGTLPASYSIFSSWGYMTSRGLELQATSGGADLYDQKTSTAPPVVIHDPPIPMTGAQPIQWSCRYYNDQSRALAFGDSAVNNAWCLYMAGYSPADPSNPDVLSVFQ